MDEIQAWLVGRLPEEWHEGEPQVTVDREEILVVCSIAPPAASDDEPVERAAEAGRINRFRTDTRAQRMRIADEAEQRFGRTLSWGAVCGNTRSVFTNVSAPAMTRLRQPERQVLDTLVEAGVARSRSDALAWAVRLVGQHESDWIEQLRDALGAVREARKSGPAA